MLSTVSSTGGAPGLGFSFSTTEGAPSLRSFIAQGWEPQTPTSDPSSLTP